MHIVGPVILLCLVGWMCFVVLQPRCDVVIRWSRGVLRHLGAFGPSKCNELEAFLQGEFGDSRLAIYGVKTRAGMMRWTIRGRLTPGERQQIRNFLHNSN